MSSKPETRKQGEAKDGVLGALAAGSPAQVSLSFFPPSPCPSLPPISVSYCHGTCHHPLPSLATPAQANLAAGFPAQARPLCPSLFRLVWWRVPGQQERDEGQRDGREAARGGVCVCVREREIKKER
jgi:hypothetical protein